MVNPIGKDGYGKGSIYRPLTKEQRERYERNYDMIFRDKKCDVCKGVGFLKGKDAKGKIIKTTCIICGGEGKLFPKGE